MTLDETLATIAQRFALDAERLITYAAADTHSGWDHGHGAWMVGSLFREEGQILYALTRYLNADTVVELGTHVGCSTTHLAQALMDNENGMLHAIDIWQGAGAEIPDALRPRITQHFTDGAAWLRNADMTIDLVFEDTLHSIDMTCDMWLSALPKVRAGGFIVSHDAAHYLAGADVRAGIHAAGIHDYLIVKPDGCECGLAIYQVSV